MATDPFCMTVFAPAAFRMEIPHSGFESVSDALKVTADKVFPFWVKYLHSFFFSLRACTGVGTDIAPQNHAQTYFGVFSVLVGIGVYCGIIGFATMTISDYQKDKAQKFKFLSDLSQFLEQRNISQELRQQVMDYYSYRWARNMEGAQLLKDEEIHQKLRDKLTLQIHKKFIESNEAFKEQDEDCQRAVMDALSHYIFLPGQYVVSEGQKSDAMFFIVSGKLARYDQMGRFMNHYFDMDLFGASEFFKDSCYKYTVVSKEHTEVFKLTRDKFKRLLGDFPKLRDKIHTISIRDRRSMRSSIDEPSPGGWSRLSEAMQEYQTVKEVGSRIAFQDFLTQFLQEPNAPAPAQEKTTGFLSAAQSFTPGGKLRAGARKLSVMFGGGYSPLSGPGTPLTPDEKQRSKSEVQRVKSDLDATRAERIGSDPIPDSNIQLPGTNTQLPHANTQIPGTNTQLSGSKSPLRKIAGLSSQRRRQLSHEVVKSDEKSPQRAIPGQLQRLGTPPTVRGPQSPRMFGLQAPKRASPKRLTTDRPLQHPNLRRMQMESHHLTKEDRRGSRDLFGSKYMD
eukprot:4865_1